MRQHSTTLSVPVLPPFKFGPTVDPRLEFPFLISEVESSTAPRSRSGRPESLGAVCPDGLWRWFDHVLRASTMEVNKRTVRQESKAE